MAELIPPISPANNFFFVSRNAKRSWETETNRLFRVKAKHYAILHKNTLAKWYNTYANQMKAGV